jgi:hypothetical protein
VTSEAQLRVGARGAFFATRHAARQIYDEAVALLGDDDGSRLLLDFAGVEAVTVTFADELVANLVARYGARIVVAGMNREVGEAVTVALTRRAGTSCPAVRHRRGAASARASRP